MYTIIIHIHTYVGIFSDGNYQHPPGFCWDTNCYSGTDDTFIDNYSIDIPLETYTIDNQSESSTLQHDLLLIPESSSVSQQESYIINNNDNNNNIQYVLDSFINQINLEINKTKGYNIAFKMGSDFHYSNAYMWYKNLDRLIFYMNKYYNNKYNLFYSSPIQYTQAKSSEQNNIDR